MLQKFVGSVDICVRSNQGMSEGERHGMAKAGQIAGK